MTSADWILIAIGSFWVLCITILLWPLGRDTRRRR
jgi:hypothetical protein